MPNPRIKDKVVEVGGEQVTITGDDPVDAILHRLNDIAFVIDAKLESLTEATKAIPPVMSQLANGVADERNIHLLATLNNVRQLLEQIEQLPNEFAHERGPIAREAMAMIDKETAKV